MLNLLHRQQIGFAIMRRLWLSVRNRSAFAWKLLGRTWVRYVLPLWAIICTYDTALSQLVPNSWEEKFPKMKEIAGGWLPWWGWALILAVIITAASFEYAFQVSDLVRSDVGSDICDPRNTLHVVTGSGKLFDEIIENPFGIHHSVSVAVQNRGALITTNCCLYRKYVSYDYYYGNLFMLKSQFSLQPGERLFVKIASLNEEKVTQNQHQIVLCEQVGGYINRPPWLPPGEYMIALEATSLETEPFEIFCRLWVDGQGELRLATLGSPTSVSYDVPIWMAIQYVGLKINEVMNADYLPRSRAAIRQKAIESKLEIWGKKQIQDNPQSQTWKFSEAITAIEPTYWDGHKIGPYASVNPINVNNPYTIYERRSDKAPNGWEDSYADLRVNWNDVVRLWR